MPKIETESRGHFAIIGAGYAGLACAYELTEQGRQVTLFDAGSGASRVSAGLLHPYPGLKAKLHPQGLEGMEATKRLLEVAQQHTNQKVFTNSGLLRILTSDNTTTEKWIESAITVYPEPYLDGLWKACEARGAKRIQQHITSLDELDSFDQVIIAAGWGTHDLIDLPLTPVKGQILELAWPQNLPPLAHPIMAKRYLLMTSDNSRVLIGSTFERDAVDFGPDEEFARKELLPSAIELVPELAEAKILACRAGVRVSAPQHLPIAKRLSPRLLVLTGLGSKGLLHHARLAEKVSQVPGAGP